MLTRSQCSLKVETRGNFPQESILADRSKGTTGIMSSAVGSSTASRSRSNLRVSDDDWFADHKVRNPGHDDGHVVGGRGVVGRGRGRAFPGGGGGLRVVNCALTY